LDPYQNFVLRAHSLFGYLRCNKPKACLDAAPLLNGCFEIRVCGRGFVKKGLERPDPNMPIPKAFWMSCFNRRARYSSLEEALEHEGLAEYR